MTDIWGAPVQNWVGLRNVGLGPDLLPVVSNPKAAISPNSTMRDIGKTPSLFNKLGQVTGIKQWTQKQASEGELDKWQQVPDYGICIQTRRLRALDVDVGDAGLADAIRLAVYKELGEHQLPLRHRSNSGKCLLAFYLEGEYPKRVVKVEGGMVEFLGNGQQFIAYGTHTSGVRYEWSWPEGMADYPTLKPETFERVWKALVDQFGVAPDHQAGIRMRGEHKHLHDPNVEHLNIIGDGPDGQLYIECPWAANHTADTGQGQTTYLPAGTNGYERGHFHCLHASCAEKTDGDFLAALGVVAHDFEVIEAETDPVTNQPKRDRPPTKGDKNGLFASIQNICNWLRRPDLTGLQLRYDNFRDEIMCAEYGTESWRPLKDVDYSLLRLFFDERGFKPVGRELIRDSVEIVALECKFDSAAHWLGGLKWDGVKRIEGFYHRYLKTEDSPYTRALGLYMWTAMAGRCLEPGVQADMVPILVGEQGLRKTSAVCALVPSQEFFAEVSFSESEDNLARRMRGCLVAEIGELKGLHSRELEAIKAFITRRTEKWIPKFKELPATYGRRLIFVGTTNSDQFLADDTGNRRWLPVRVLDYCDVAAIEADRDQLWAEARTYFEVTGVLHREAEKLANGEHDAYVIADPWEDRIHDWLYETNIDGTVPADTKLMRSADILGSALGINADRTATREFRRLATVMKRLGFFEVSRRDETGRRQRGWSKSQKVT